MVSQSPQRDSNGRFSVGCQAGPGRPRRDQEREYHAAFSTALPPSDLAQIIQALAQKAKAGNVSAARLLLEHACGRPSIRIAFEDPHDELRVAGLTPDRVIEERLAALRTRIEEIRAREARIREGVQMPPTSMPAAATPTLPSECNTYE